MWHQRDMRHRILQLNPTKSEIKKPAIHKKGRFFNNQSTLELGDALIVSVILGISAASGRHNQV